MSSRFLFAAAFPSLLLLWCSGCASLSRNQVDPDIVAARQLSLRGESAMQRGRWGEAETVLSDALEVCPMDQRMRHQYAETLWNLGAKDDAIEHMEYAVKLSGGRPELAVRLGDMYLDRGTLEAAALQADLAIAANSHLAEAWALRGDVHQRQGQFDAGLSSYHRALSYQTHFPRVQLALAEEYRRRGKHRRVLATLQNLADGYPDEEVPGRIYYLQGLAQKQLGRYAAAAGSFSLAAQRDPPSPDVLFQLAEAQWLAGDRHRAYEAARRALAVAPGHLPSQHLLAQLQSEQRTAHLDGPRANR